MRFSKPIEYTQLSQALSRGACPICAFLKNFQSECLLTAKIHEISSVCNFHAWALAGVADKSDAVRIFREMLKRQWLEHQVTKCSICVLLDEEEQDRMVELTKQLAQTRVREWMKVYGALCMVHGRILYRLAPEALRPLVRSIVERTSTELREQLGEFQESAHTPPSDTRGGGGILGRAAEFLVAQRGLRR